MLEEGKEQLTHQEGSPENKNGMLYFQRDKTLVPVPV
jgi:hypothetical protein